MPKIPDYHAFDDVIEEAKRWAKLLIRFKCDRTKSIARSMHLIASRNRYVKDLLSRLSPSEMPGYLLSREVRLGTENGAEQFSWDVPTPRFVGHRSNYYRKGIGIGAHSVKYKIKYIPGQKLKLSPTAA